MAPRSKVERLPEGARKTLEEWLVEFNAGRIKLDDVMTRFESLLEFNGITATDRPSRTAVYQHAQKFAALGERMKRSQAFADAFAKEVGPQLAEGKGMQVLLQAFQSLAFDMLGRMDDEETFDAENLMFFARAVQAAAGAQKTDADRAAKIREEERKRLQAEATKVVEAVAKRTAGGLSKEMVDAIKAEILGIK